MSNGLFESRRRYLVGDGIPVTVIVELPSFVHVGKGSRDAILGLSGLGQDLLEVV